MKYAPTQGVTLVEGSPRRLRTPENGQIIVDDAVVDAWCAPDTAEPLTAGCLAELAC